MTADSPAGAKASAAFRDPDFVHEQTGVVLAAGVTAEPLEPLAAQARAVVMTEAMGALVVFEGIVRNHDAGARVMSLSYSAHPQAGTILAQIAAEVCAAHPEVRLWALHRVAALSIGESALTVLAAAAHRAEAFAACEALVERVKAEVPIWKKQIRADGQVDWVGL